ncbi:MAG: YIP1 family protein [Planctomycetes bacterium]|nr:YIP1 family protein [Planctomycetota bacterium]
MRCKNCDYRLWNLRSRQCPECGTPFCPSEFEFLPNRVEFGCPHCDLRYYGTGPRGHLEPVAFECSGCGQAVHMDEMVLLPAAGVAEEQTAPPRVPWLNRAKRGFFSGWLATIGQALVAPGRLIRSVPVESSLPQAWWFGILCQLPVFVLGWAVVMIPMLVFTSRQGGALSVVGFAIGLGTLGYLFAFMVFLTIWGLTTHGLLHLVAAPTGGLRRTYQALAYSAGANVVSGTPCVGFYLGWIWWLVSAVVMVSRGQKVSGGRAALAVLTLPIGGLVTIVGVFVGMSFYFLPTVRPAMTRAASLAETQVVLDAVLAHMTEHSGSGPAHAVILVADGKLAPFDLVTFGTDTIEDDVPVGSITLADFGGLSSARKAIVAQQAVAALPDNVVAHRLGDCVFTYHGLDAGPDQALLWVVILAADPSVNALSDPNREVYVGQVDGTVTAIPIADFPQSLKVQNAQRRQHDLPPLPHPDQVTHAAPHAVDPKVDHAE